MSGEPLSLTEIAAGALQVNGYHPGSGLTYEDVMVVALAVKLHCAEEAKAVASRYKTHASLINVDRQAEVARNGALSAVAAVEAIPLCSRG